jgi:hypothetical protein
MNLMVLRNDLSDHGAPPGAAGPLLAPGEGGRQGGRQGGREAGGEGWMDGWRDG